MDNAALRAFYDPANDNMLCGEFTKQYPRQTGIEWVCNTCGDKIFVSGDRAIVPTSVRAQCDKCGRITIQSAI